jgi:hypothetical protein
MSSKKNAPIINFETENTLLKLEVKELKKRIDLLEKMIGIMEKSHESEMNAINHYKTIVDAHMGTHALKYYQTESEKETESIVSSTTSDKSLDIEDSKTNHKEDMNKKNKNYVTKNFIRVIS